MWVWVQGVVACLASERERERDKETGSSKKMAAKARASFSATQLGTDPRGALTEVDCCIC